MLQIVNVRVLRQWRVLKSVIAIVVTETYGPSATAFSQHLLCCVDASASSAADHYLNGNHHGKRRHPRWYERVAKSSLLFIFIYIYL